MGMGTGAPSTSAWFSGLSPDFDHRPLRRRPGDDHWPGTSSTGDALARCSAIAPTYWTDWASLPRSALDRTDDTRAAWISRGSVPAATGDQRVTCGTNRRMIAGPFSVIVSCGGWSVTYRPCNVAHDEMGSTSPVMVCPSRGPPRRTYKVVMW
jgi:hypothetical protein